jgi:hypothetical protein
LKKNGDRGSRFFSLLAGADLSHKALGAIHGFLWLTVGDKAIFIARMKTTIDLPEELLEKSKITAAKRRTSFKNLVIEGLERVISADESLPSSSAALKRLRRGYELANNPLKRAETHAR